MSPPVTIVTGAAGALGTAVCAELLERGHRVAAIDLERSRARLDALAAGAGGNALPLVAPPEDGWLATIATVGAQLGPPTGAVLVAGGWRGGHRFHEEGGAETFEAMLELNLRSAERALRPIVASMVERRRGSVVVIGSRAVEQPWTSAGASAYAASKAALVALVRAVAQEVVHDGVRLNAVLPSVIDTPANREAMPEAAHDSWVRPEELARVIAFLLGDDAAPISGAALPAYGRA